MKKLILALVIITIVAGGISFVIFVATGSFNFNSHEVNLSEFFSLTDKTFNGIDINTTSVDINLHPADYSENEVKAYLKGTSWNNLDEPGVELVIEEDNNNLEIYTKNTRAFFSFHSDYNLILDVYLPKDYESNFIVKSVSGDIVIKDLTSNKDLLVSTTSGDISLENYLGNITAHSVSGNVLGSNLKSDNSIEVETTSGDVSLNGLLDYINIKTVSGDVNADFDEFRDTNYIKTTSGDVVVKAPKDSDLYIRFDSASGELLSDFSTRSNTTGFNLGIDTTSGDAEVIAK